MICVNAHTQPHTWTHQMSMRDLGIQPVAIALMPRSKYKHVTWRSRATNDGKPWQATVQRKYLGSFAQEEEAAKAVAKFLRQPMANLLTSYSAPKETHQRTHRYVYWHCRDQLWQVKIGGKVWGSFVDHADALAVVVKKAGLSQTQLQLHSNDACKSSQGKRHAVSQQAEWFRHLYRAYAGIYGPTYPGDLNDMHLREHRGSEILAHPNFIVPHVVS